MLRFVSGPMLSQYPPPFREDKPHPEGDKLRAETAHRNHHKPEHGPETEMAPTPCSPGSDRSHHFPMNSNRRHRASAEHQTQVEKRPPDTTPSHRLLLLGPRRVAPIHSILPAVGRESRVCHGYPQFMGGWRSLP